MISELPTDLSDEVLAREWTLSHEDKIEVFRCRREDNRLRFPFADTTHLALLQSRIHEAWSVELSGTIKTDQRYNPSRAFETFPFPKRDPRTVMPSLEKVGEKFANKRAEYMNSSNVGLTKTYNAIYDPACDDACVLELRRLSEEMDRAVLDAYGWSDIAVPPYCQMNDADKRALATFEDEVIDRLYVLNAERAKDEESLGLTKRSGPFAREKKDKKKRTKGQGKLF